jgi:NAD-dependent SIR2 family protein deacetylase
MTLMQMFFKDCDNCGSTTIWTKLEQRSETQTLVECDQCERQEIMPTTVHEDALDG